MNLSIGIVGLPNVGKSTLFKLLTKREVNIANYPFCTIDPNVGVVPVPDERLDRLANLSKSQKKIPAVVEFYDIAGLVKGAHKGEGLGNQFLAHIREVSAVLMVLRCFPDRDVIHVEKTIDPLRDLEIINTELELKDLESREKEHLLSKKRKIYLLNGRQDDVPTDLLEKIKNAGDRYIIANLADKGGKELDSLVKTAYETLDLISFFTTGPEETRAWTIKQGTKAPQAAGVIHSDFEKKFIKAEVVNWNDLLAAGGWQAAKAGGLIRLEGKDYKMRDGDVMLVRHGR